MDLWSSLGVLARRWLICVPLALLTVAAVGLVSLRVVAPQYRSSGTLLLTAPAARPVDQNGQPNNAVNPYNNFGGPLNVVGDVLSRVFSTDAKAAELKAQGLPGTFTVASATDGLSPVVTVTGDARVGADAEASVTEVLAALQDDLLARQKATGAPQSSFVQSQVLTAAAPAHRQYGSIARAAAAAAAAGLVVTLGLTFLADALLLRRSPRRSWRAAANTAATTETSLRWDEAGEMDPDRGERGASRWSGAGRALTAGSDRYGRRGQPGE